MPCYVLSREEAASYRRKKMGGTKTSNSTTANATTTTLVQYLTFPNPQRGQYKYVDESSLLPFGAEDGSSSSFNDTYLQRYIAQEIAQYQKGLAKTTTPWDRPIEDTMKIMRIYLRRVFDTAWNAEMKSREMARNDLQDYYDDEASEEDGPVVAANTKGKSRKLPKKKVEVLELEDDDGDDSDDGNDDYADTNIFEECTDHNGDDDDMDDLDAPYTQAITYDPDDFRMDDDEGVSNEPIRPGDVIEYYSPI